MSDIQHIHHDFNQNSFGSNSILHSYYVYYILRGLCVQSRYQIIQYNLKSLATQITTCIHYLASRPYLEYVPHPPLRVLLERSLYLADPSASNSNSNRKISIVYSIGTAMFQRCKGKKTVRHIKKEDIIQ